LPAVASAKAGGSSNTRALNTTRPCIEFVPRRSSITRCRLSDIVKRRSIRRCTQ